MQKKAATFVETEIVFLEEERQATDKQAVEDV